ncbi:MAG: DJ-1 family glyoxalase III [Oligoflexus sp.]
MKKACVLLADGFEEVEAVTMIDVMRRAGISVTTLAVGTNNQQVKGSHGIAIEADQNLEAGFQDWDLVALPGGQPGANHLRDHSGVKELLKQQYQKNGLIAAICAAPIALSAADCIGGRKITCYPGFEEQIHNAKHVDAAVVHDGTLITGRGPGAAMAFSLKLVEVLLGEQKSKKLQEQLLYLAS